MSSHIIYGLLNRHNVVKKGDKLLDLGCGNGIFLNQLSVDKKTTGIGVDRMSERISLAQKVNSYYRFNNLFLIEDFEKNPFEVNRDVVILLDVMEHLRSPEKLIKILSKSTISKIIIQTPYGEDKKYIIKTERFLYGKDKHLRPGFEVPEIKRILERNGYIVTVIENNFYFISQIIYEALEMVRRKSRFVYAILWPFFYPICWVDTIFLKFGIPNGLFVVAIKK